MITAIHRGSDAGHDVDERIDEQGDDAAGDDPADRAVGQLEGAGEGEAGDDGGDDERRPRRASARRAGSWPGWPAAGPGSRRPRDELGRGDAGPAAMVAVRGPPRPSCHHRPVDQEESALRIDPEEAAGARLRLRLDWRTFVWLALAVLGALALLGVLPQHHDDAHPHRASGSSSPSPSTRSSTSCSGASRCAAGSPWPSSPSLVLGLAALLVLVLGPRAVAEARKFSDQLPETVDELGGCRSSAAGCATTTSARRCRTGSTACPSEFTDERVAEIASTLVSGIASVAIVAVLAIAVLIDGENLLARFRRLLPEPRQEQADAVGGIAYRTLGRYFGGSITVAILMGFYVLTLGLLLGVPLAPLAALWAMLTDLIPQVGGFLGGTFFVLLAVTQGVVPALIAGVGFVLYMNIENHLIQPAIVGRSVDLTPPTTMVAAFVGGAIAGIPGALVATPAGRRREGDLQGGPGHGGARAGVRRRRARPGCASCSTADRQRRGRPGTSSLHCDTRRPR